MGDNAFEPLACLRYLQVCCVPSVIMHLNLLHVKDILKYDVSPWVIMPLNLLHVKDIFKCTVSPIGDNAFEPLAC